MVIMEESGNLYLKNLLSLIDLRLYSCLGLCEGDLRDEARDRIEDIAADPDRTGFSPDPEEVAAFENHFHQLMETQDRLLADAEASGPDLPIETIRGRFGLDPNEMALLAAVLAPAVDARYRKVYKLFGGSEFPRMDFLLSLLENDGLKRYEYTELLAPESSLLSHALIEPDCGADEVPGPSAVYHPSPGLLEWLNGIRDTAEYYGRAEWFDVPEPDTDQDPVFVSLSAAIRTPITEGKPVPIVSYYGPDAELIFSKAKHLAAEMRSPLLKLDLKGLEFRNARSMIRQALRDCVLNAGVAVLCGIDDWADTMGFMPPELSEFLADWDVPTILLTNHSVNFLPDTVNERRLVLRLPVPRLTGTQRFRVWKELISDLPMEEQIDDDALRTLAGQFMLSTAQIRGAVSSGQGIAVAAGRSLRLADLYEGARMNSMHHLSDLAKKMPARFTIKDLVLPEKQKQEIDELIAMAKNRSLVLEEWGVGKKLVSGTGISALFTGVPGTGKTLTAQVIAGELGLDLYVVDLSTIVSKYIGETEKNLERIFTEAQNSNVILFFDEADSLFGRRSEVSDAHDRYANIEVGYLLQRIETYDGIVLMATNLGANLDEAFARRIHYIIDFPFPDEATRLRLWQLLLPDHIEKEPDIDPAPFAALYKIAGGNIRNAIVWAIYDAARNKRPLSRADLIHGVEREYQKMGKVFPNFPY